MRLNLQTKTTGYLWVKNALWLFKKTPRIYLAITISTYLLMIILPSFLNKVGSFMGLMIGVIGSATVMLTAHELRHQRLSRYAPFAIDTLKMIIQNRSILWLALIYATAFTLLQMGIELFLQLLLPNIHAQYQTYAAAISDLTQKLSDEELIRAHLFINTFRFILLLPHLLLFMFFCMTPALVYWSKITPLKAILYNAVACIKNWHAWLFYILGWSLLILLLFIIMILFFALLFFTFDTAGIALAIILSTTFALLFIAFASAVMSLSLYFAYQNNFIAKK